MFEGFHNLRLNTETFTWFFGKSALKIRTTQTNCQELSEKADDFRKKLSAFL